MKLPEILTQNRPKYIKSPKILPEIWTPYTNREGQCLPAPPTSYAHSALATNKVSNLNVLRVMLRLTNIGFLGSKLEIL